MTRKERKALTEQYITQRELLLTQIVSLAVYLIVVVGFIPTTNFLLFCGMCLFLLIGLDAIRDQFLLWLNERRCKAKEVKSEISQDDD